MSIPLKQHWSLLVSYLKHQRPQVILMAALLFGSIGLQVLNPQILRYFLDSAQSGGERRALILAALLFIGVALVNQALSVAATYTSENVGWTATNMLRADLALHCLQLDMAFHKARTPGELIERIDGDITALANFFSQFVVKMLGNLLLLAGVLVVVYRENWRIGLALTVFALIVLFALSKAQGFAVPYWKRARQSSAELFGFLEERLAGTEDIRSSGAMAYTMRQLYERMRERLQQERRAALIGSLTWAPPWILFALATAAIFLISRNLFNTGQITIGTAYLFFFYTQTLIRPLMMITRQIEDLQKASAGIARIQELYQISSTIQSGETDLPSGPLSVAFEAVTFVYEDRPLSVVSSPLQDLLNDELRTTDRGPRTTLQDISFQLAPGRVLGVLGRTGSGKTTLTRLLFRLYDPQQGAVRLGDVDVRAAHLADLRQRVGMVTQEVQLFHATIRDNLTLFDEQISDEQILKVLDDLGLLPWYRALPHGLDTLLASGGGLSAGEAQVLAFTRVFLRNPGLVVLDEASSRLDPATEALIERAIDKLLHERTGIIIAHRLATVLRADEILILENGRVREHGPRARLMSDPDSRFSQLLRTGMEEVLA
jgi:ATP-binding cassette, subfamily B, bacterial